MLKEKFINILNLCSYPDLTIFLNLDLESVLISRPDPDSNKPPGSGCPRSPVHFYIVTRFICISLIYFQIIFVIKSFTIIGSTVYVAIIILIYIWNDMVHQRKHTCPVRWAATGTRPGPRWTPWTSVSGSSASIRHRLTPHVNNPSEVNAISLLHRLIC